MPGADRKWVQGADEATFSVLSIRIQTRILCSLDSCYWNHGPQTSSHSLTSELVRSKESQAPLRTGESQPAFYQDPWKIHMHSRVWEALVQSRAGKLFLYGGQKVNMFLLYGTDSHCFIYFTLSLLLESHRQCGNKWMELCFNKIYFPKQVWPELALEDKVGWWCIHMSRITDPKRYLSSTWILPKCSTQWYFQFIVPCKRSLSSANSWFWWTVWLLIIWYVKWF